MWRAIPFACVLLAAVALPASAQVDPYVASVRLEFNDQISLSEPVRIVIVPDNGPAPQPRASLK